MSGGQWNKGKWGVDVWGTPDAVQPPAIGTPPPGSEGVGQVPGGGYDDLGTVSTIELSASMVITQLIEYQPPPPKVVPFRNYRSVMNEYRVLNGRPVAPPVVDVNVPVNVTVAMSEPPMSNLSRSLPEDIDTRASMRWYVDNDYVSYSDSGHTTYWYDTSGTLAWQGHDTYQPILADGYSYLIPTPNSAEILQRPALVFNPRSGSCMNATFSPHPVESADNIEFIMVVWSHPLAVGAQASTILDNGGEVRGLQTMPFPVNDGLSGLRQGLSRFTGEGMLLWQDHVGFPMWWALISSGRPVLVRARYGMNPLLECWGPKGLHMIHQSVLPQERKGLATNYVLGREFGQVSATTNAGMHLMEVNYYDHTLADDELASIVQALDSCYAIST